VTDATTEPAVDERFGWYRTTVVEAEVAPGRTVRLTGAGAVGDWPFPGAVVVLTAYNPGAARPDRATNEAANDRLADAIRTLGAPFVPGTGTAPDGTHAEPSLVVVGLPRDDGVLLGRRFGQDAIFEIDATTVRLVSCCDDRVEEWRRTIA